MNSFMRSYDNTLLLTFSFAFVFQRYLNFVLIQYLASVSTALSRLVDQMSIRALPCYASCPGIFELNISSGAPSSKFSFIDLQIRGR